MASTTFVVHITIDGPPDDAQSALETALDNGALQDAVAEYASDVLGLIADDEEDEDEDEDDDSDNDAGTLSVTSACIVSVLQEPEEGWATCASSV